MSAESERCANGTDCEPLAFTLILPPFSLAAAFGGKIPAKSGGGG